MSEPDDAGGPDAPFSRAKWIHAGIEGCGVHYAWFIRRFELAGSPDRAVLRVTADRVYRLHVNDSVVGYGPLPARDHYWSFDEYDLSGELTEGTNFIAILVQQWEPGVVNRDKPVSATEGPRPLAVLAQLSVSVGQQEDPVIVGTDASWHAYREPGWVHDSPRRFADGELIEFVELYHSDVARGRADSADYDRYPCARVFEHNTWLTHLYESEPLFSTGPLWQALVPRGIPHMQRRTHRPEAIARVGELACENADANARSYGPERWQGLERIRDLEHCTVANERSLLAGSGDQPAILSAVQGEQFPFPDYEPVIILDFGSVRNARISLDVETPEPVDIDLVYAVGLYDGAALARRGRTYHVKRFRSQGGRERWTSFDWACFRYLQVVVRTPGGYPLSVGDHPDVRLYSVEMEETAYPLDDPVAFRCSDPDLEALHAASVRTAALCTNDRLMDNPVREKTSWNGDLNQVIPTLAATFGSLAVVRRHFQMVFDEQLPSGNLSSIVPGQMEMIFDHALRLPIFLNVYHQLTGDDELVHTAMPPMKRFLDYLDRYVDPDGLIRYVPFQVWFGWAELDRRSPNATLNLLYLSMLHALEELGDYAGEASWTADARERMVLTAKAIRSEFWSRQLGAFVDSTAPGDPSLSEQTNGLALATGVCTRVEQQRIVDVVFARGMGLDRNSGVSKCDPAFQYHVLDGLVVAGRPDLALDFMRERNCNWVRAGLETIPEVWRSTFASEISNVQATTPEAYLLDRIALGFRPLEPGCAKIEVAPAAASLESAAGAVNTPHGPVTIAWENTDEELRLRIDKPDGVEAFIRLPDGIRLSAASCECLRYDETEQGTVYTCVVAADVMTASIQGVSARL